MVANAMSFREGVTHERVTMSKSTFLAPIMAGAAAAWVSWHLGFVPKYQDPAGFTSLASGIASAGATLLGFMLAAAAVLASINHTHLVSMMRKFGHYHDLLATLFFGSTLMLACLLCGFAFLFGVPNGPRAIAWTVGLHVAALTSLLDVGRKFYFTLKNLRDA